MRVFKRPEGTRIREYEKDYRDEINGVPFDLVGSLVTKKNMSPRTYVMNAGESKQDREILQKIDEDLVNSKLQKFLSHMKLVDIKNCLIFCINNCLAMKDHILNADEES